MHPLTDCSYGDHYSSCESLERRECYFRSYRQACCATCRMLQSSNSGKKLWHLENHKKQWWFPFFFSIVPSLCSATSMPLMRMLSWTEDKNPVLHPAAELLSWQAKQVPKPSTFQKTTQDALYFAACPWGDRYMDCTGADCSDLKTREYCCETCDRQDSEHITTTMSPLSPGKNYCCP